MQVLQMLFLQGHCCFLHAVQHNCCSQCLHGMNEYHFCNKTWYKCSCRFDPQCNAFTSYVIITLIRAYCAWCVVSLWNDLFGFSLSACRYLEIQNICTVESCCVTYLIVREYNTFVCLLFIRSHWVCLSSVLSSQ